MKMETKVLRGCAGDGKLCLATQAGSAARSLADIAEVGLNCQNTLSPFQKSFLRNELKLTSPRFTCMKRTDIKPVQSSATGKRMAVSGHAAHIRGGS